MEIAPSKSARAAKIPAICIGVSRGSKTLHSPPKVRSHFRRQLSMETVAALTNLEKQESPETCVVVGLDGNTMQVKLPHQLKIGSAVKVEADDTLSLGEVSYCRPDGDGYVAWVEVMQALHNVNELTRLARALLA